MDINQYASLFESSKSAPVSGLVGRIIRGKEPKDFLTLTDDPDRRIVFLVDSTGLEKLLGQNGYEMLIRIGYDTNHIKNLVEKNTTFKLVVFPEGMVAKLATWDNMLDMVIDMYPEVSAKVAQWRDALKANPLKSIEAGLGYTFGEVDKVGKTDQRFMTLDRYKQCFGTLAETRAFLYFTVHMRELYSGDGWTYNAQGQKGVQEFIIPNKPIAQLGQHKLLDINVQLPNFNMAKNKSSQHWLPIPNHFKPDNAAEWGYSPDIPKIRASAFDWAKQHGIKPSGSDKYKVHVLLIDEQKDFCFPSGSLYVGGRSGRGAIEDSAKVSSFIYRNLGIITDITTTLDTHFAFQIFSSAFWQDQNGQAINPFTVILTEDIQSGKYKPNPAMASWLCNGNYSFLLKQVEHYCDELKKQGKYSLLAWPEHCLLGSDGHSLVGVIHEARMFHSYARGSQSLCEVKGGHPLTENYSVLRPEVLTRWDGKPLAQKNTNFVKTLLASDAVIIAGQADSHCVASSIDDLLTEIIAQDPKLASKVYIMTDCMSAVVVPGVSDYTPEAEKAHQKFANAGMHLVESTTPIQSWPGIEL